MPATDGVTEEGAGRPVPGAPDTTMSTPTLLAVAHGSRDPRSARAVAALFDRVRSLRPGLDVRVSYLDHVSPSTGDALAALDTEGVEEAVVLPTLLTAAFHSKVDLPEVLSGARERGLGVRVHYADTLGPDPLLLAAVERRLSEAGAHPSPDTALVLASAGSSDPEANATIEAMARDLAARAWREWCPPSPPPPLPRPRRPWPRCVVGAPGGWRSRGTSWPPGSSPTGYGGKRARPGRRSSRTRSATSPSSPGWFWTATTPLWPPGTRRCDPGGGVTAPGRWSGAVLGVVSHNGFHGDAEPAHHERLVAHRGPLTPPGCHKWP